MKKLYASNDSTKYTTVDDDIFKMIKEMNLKFCIQSSGHYHSTKQLELPCMDKKKLLGLHVFVYIMKTGIIPTTYIDHIDGHPENNCFSNLRIATHQQNTQNQRRRKNNISGYIGVGHHHKTDKRGYEFDYWIARIKKPDGKREAKLFSYTENGKQHAAMWRDTKAIEYFGEFHGQLNFPI